MDTLSHGLWAYALMYFINKPYAWLAFLFGVLPDLVTFGPFFVHRIFTGNFISKKPDINLVPKYVFFMYKVSHSLVILFLVSLIIYFLFNKIPWYLFGWLLHILIDIPLHTEDFFPVKFLYPISDFYINGLSWGSLWYVIINFSLLAIVYAIIIYTKYIKK